MGTETAEVTALAVQTQAASEALDAHVREIIQWHFSPETGCPFWLEFKSKLNFDPLTEVQSFDDLEKFPPLASHVL